MKERWLPVGLLAVVLFVVNVAGRVAAADIIPARFDIYPLVDLDATKRMLAAQVAARK